MEIPPYSDPLNREIRAEIDHRYSHTPQLRELRTTKRLQFALVDGLILSGLTATSILAREHLGTMVGVDLFIVGFGTSLKWFSALRMNRF